MKLVARLIYAAFLTVAVVMAVGMLGMLAGLDVIDVLFHPVFAVSAYLVALILAPWVERHIPFTRK